MHRRHAGVDGDLLELDVLDGGGGVEARVQDDLGPQPQAEQHDHRERVDVEERQDAEGTLLAFLERVRLALRRLRVLRAGRRQIGVGQHCALGQAGRAAGVLDDRERLPRIADVLRLVAPVVVEEVAERDDALVAFDLRQHVLRRHEGLHRPRRERIFGEFADDERLQPRRGEQLFRLRIDRRSVEGDENVRFAVLDFEFERAERVERRIVDDGSAGLQHAEKSDRIMGGVGQIEAHVHAGPDPELLEARRCAVRERFELRISDPLVHELQRRKRVEAPRQSSRILCTGPVSIGASQRAPAG